MRGELAIETIRKTEYEGLLPHTHAQRDGIVFTASIPEGEQGSVLLYDRRTGEEIGEVPFPEEPYSGQVHAIKMKGLAARHVAYCLQVGGRRLPDPYAQVLIGSKGYGPDRGKFPLCGFLSGNFSWEDENRQEPIPYRDSVFYELNVRSFTKSRRSGARHKGTFKGIMEKIPYLKDLGVTALVLMPCYEFDENAPNRKSEVGVPAAFLRQQTGEGSNQAEYGPDLLSADKKTGRKEAGRRGAAGPAGFEAERTGFGKVNLWGFGPGLYFAPKASYCASDRPDQEFRALVKALHQAGMELIMEMDFSGPVEPHTMQEALIWWKEVYHVDGFFLFGRQSDLNAISRCSALTDVKLITDYFDRDTLYPCGRKGDFRNLAECNRGFQNDARRLLKGDPGTLFSYLARTRYNPKDTAVVNQVCFHDGFTLMDLVSYNESHQEGGEEGGHEPAPAQYSWNCGAEGPSRRKDVLSLRLRQIKNALAMLLLSQGTPMILAGDENGNSQAGDSNAWCLDSDRTWLDWSSGAMAQKILAYAKDLIRLRKKYALLHQERELSTAAMGDFFPQISCHGRAAWFGPSGQGDLSAGLMLCGKSDKGAQILYVGYNFHWERKELALPFLPDGKKWKLILATSEEETEVGKTVSVPSRSLVLLEGC